MFKDILVPWIDDDSEAAPLDAAVALAKECEAHVAMLVVVDVPAPMPSDWGAMAYDLYARLHEEARARAQKKAEDLRARFVNLDAPFEVRMAEALSLYPSNTIAMHARYADLTVLSSVPQGSAEAGLRHDAFHAALLQSGQPVLVMPPKATLALTPKKAVIAWKPTRESSRAVRDAMPFLHAADSVDVLVIDPKVGEAAHGGEPGADLATHLARHGLDVEVVVRPSMNFSVAYALLDYARQVGADLIVAGGYGRSRLREAMLGGVTRELLQTTHLPVLFAH